MRLVKVYKFSLALLLASPASCSPWRKARSRQEESNSATPQAINTYGTAPNAAVSLSSSSLDTPLSLSDTPADLTPTQSEVLSRVHTWLEEAADPSSHFLVACTSDALRSWTDRCDSLAGSESKQKQLAAMLTICQHESSSKLAVPTECRNWLDGRANVDECLDTFSRSPQYWISYSNFASKIIDTCHALAREQNLSIFKQVFHKMVVVHQQHEESLLARHEQDRQEAAKMATWHSVFEGFFHEVQSSFINFTGLVKHFQQYSESASSALNEYKQDQQVHKDGLHNLFNDLQALVAHLPSFFRESAKKQASELKTDLQDTLQIVHQQNEVALNEQAIRHRSSLVAAAHEHQQALAEILMSLNGDVDLLSSNLIAANEAVQEYDQQLQIMGSRSMSVLNVLDSLQKKSEDSHETIVSNQLLQEEYFLRQKKAMSEQEEAVSALIVRTKEAEFSVMLSSIWSMNWLAMLAAVGPAYRHFLSVQHLRVAGTSVSIALLAACWPEKLGKIVQVASNGVYMVTKMLFDLLHPPVSMPSNFEVEAEVPWRTQSGKEWIAV